MNNTDLFNAFYGKVLEIDNSYAFAPNGFVQNTDVIVETEDGIAKLFDQHLLIPDFSKVS